MRLNHTLTAAAFILAASVPAFAKAPAPAANDGLDATLWLQTSVEYKASTRSVYAGATRQLDALLADKGETAALEQTGDFAAKPPAVILDIDETVLNNSAYQAWIITHHQHFSGKSWHAFANDSVSVPIPGALQFTKAAAAKGITVFYVSNRSEAVKDGTLRNLKKFGFPMKAGEDVVLLRGGQKDWTGKKGTRRAFIAKNYRILMLLGDNFGDFVDDMGGDIAGRDAMMAKYDAYWGQRWFTLPNPTYGSWQSAAVPKGGKEPRRAYFLKALKPWAGPKPAPKVEKTKAKAAQ
ncbi:5'-nucleotidase, lipoprotein e(P4) family [Kordiimonas marina]|uniref:5'-nucleotidase, lipoprotein e(P4) family n=1 Tax=Kordiimonas marina TaxID=2872312 RepID=UPI001FF55921|nr:HAD family acid phosphatase [Kordiimonas marina]MCJ9427457.1 hypothetical protein [Kordiimonas marina]